MCVGSSPELPLDEIEAMHSLCMCGASKSVASSNSHPTLPLILTVKKWLHVFTVVFLSLETFLTLHKSIFFPDILQPLSEQDLKAGIPCTDWSLAT